MGVGSEVYGALSLGRRGIGCELKPSYYRQAVKNIQEVKQPERREAELFQEDTSDAGDLEEAEADA